MTRPTLLVLGLGNLLCRDDGLGVIALGRLARRYRPPEDVELLDGGTLGLALLPHLRRARSVIMIDAVGADAPAGTLVRLEGDAVAPAVEQRLSPHQVGVADLLSGARLLDDRPTPIVLLGLVPESIELGMGLTASVEEGVDDLVEAVVVEARARGAVLTPRSDEEEGSHPLGYTATVLGV